MKVRTDFVTNSSSTSYIFVGKDVDTIIKEIKDRMIFGKYNEKFLEELEKEGFNRVLDKTSLCDRISELLHYWIDVRFRAWEAVYSANVHEVINKVDQLDDKLIVKVVINYQGDGHNHGCIRDDDWYCRMTKSGSLELIEGIFEDDFMAFFTY